MQNEGTQTSGLGFHGPRVSGHRRRAGWFEIRSRVTILCNAFDKLAQNVGALSTTATVIEFVPPSHEILRKIESFAADAEILAFLKGVHDVFSELNLRTYVHLAELKRAGLDWRGYALRPMSPGRLNWFSRTLGEASLCDNLRGKTGSQCIHGGIPSWRNGVRTNDQSSSSAGRRRLAVPYAPSDKPTHTTNSLCEWT